MTKYYLTFLILIFSFPHLTAQDKNKDGRKKYDESMRKVKLLTNADNFDAALTEINYTQVLAKQALVPQDSINFFFKKIINGIKKQRDQFKESERQYQAQLKTLVGLTSSLADVIRTDSVSATNDAGAFKTDILNQLIASLDYLSKLTNLNNEAEVAGAHLKLAVTYENIGNIEKSKSEFKQARDIALKMLDGENGKNADDAITIYLKATDAQLNILTDQGRMAECRDLLKLLLPTKRLLINSGVKYDALFGYHSAIAGYFNEMGNIDSAMFYSKLALADSRKASAFKPVNAVFINSNLKGLNNLIFLNNMLSRINTPKKNAELDSTFSYKIEAQGLINKLSDISGATGLSINNIIIFEKQVARDLTEQKKYAEALETLNNCLRRIDAFVKINSNQRNVDPDLLYADIFTEKANLYQYYNKDKSKQTESLVAAIKAWETATRDKKLLAADQHLLVSIYKKIENSLNNCFSKKDILRTYQTTLNNIQLNKAALNEYPPLNYIMGCINVNCAEIINVSSVDTANIYYIAAANFFNHSRILNHKTESAESLSKYSTAYLHKISVDIKNNNLASAEADYKAAVKYFSNRDLSFRDPDLNWDMINIHKTYGMFLASSPLNYNKAISPLDSASAAGIKSCSVALSDIYSSFRDQRNYQKYHDLAAIQLNDERTIITVPATAEDTSAKVTFYILDRAKTAKVKGIDDQIDWYINFRGIKIDTNYSAAFKKIQQEAWASGQSFQKLSWIAVDEAKDKIFITNKYSRALSKIYGEPKIEKKLDSCKILDEQYKADIQSNPTKADILKKNGLPFYTMYAGLDAMTNNIAEAKRLYKEVLDVDNNNTVARNALLKYYYNEHTDLINKADYHSSLDSLKQFLSFCLFGNNDSKKSHMLAKKILLLYDTSESRDFILTEYQLKSRYDQDFTFDNLFLNDKLHLRDHILYFNKKRDSQTFDAKTGLRFYISLTRLDESYLVLNGKSSDDSLKKIISYHYSTLVWYRLKNGITDDNLSKLIISKNYNPENIYAIAYRAPAMLMHNDLYPALDEYKAKENFDFNSTDGYPKYKDIYISNLNELQDLNRSNINIKQALALLNK